MKKEREKLLRILAPLPGLHQLLTSEKSLEAKRIDFRNFLSGLYHDFEDHPGIPSLKWVLTHNVINICRNLISKRNETLAGFSFLQYLVEVLTPDGKTGIRSPASAFLAEMDHMMAALRGEAGIYREKAPAFLKYKGLRAAKMRSADLSRMARAADSQIDRFVNGLDPETIRHRSKNTHRIMAHFDATELEWKDWKWHVRHIIKDADTLRGIVDLTEEEYRAIKLARENKIPFGITPYYLSLFEQEKDHPWDRGIRSQVIPTLRYVEKMIEKRASSEQSIDFMLEHDTSPIEGITRRYPNIVILKPILTCPQICVYCQRNWEIEDVYSPHAALSEKRQEKAIKWIEERPEINEVLITGGDPLLISNKKLEHLLFRLSRNPNIIRIRIGTRTPVTLPQRITDQLVKDINRYHIPGRREILIITHFEHTTEITPQAMEAIQKFKRYGMDVYNQLVYTYYNSRRFQAVALRRLLRYIGVTPYYTFNTKGKEETNDYRVPIARLLQEQKEEARLSPGTLRTDKVVFNVPGLGKNYLTEGQHHDVISILPDGRRVYEFHPWEKKLSLVDTYVYTDVPIYDYLQRLKKDGEDISAYRSIWYYY